MKNTFVTDSLECVSANLVPHQLEMGWMAQHHIQRNTLNNIFWWLIEMVQIKV